MSFSTRGILAGAGLAASGLLLLWLGRPRAPAAGGPADRRLLVLPLEVRAPMPENAWLRHGLAELVRLQLRQDSRLQLLPVPEAATWAPGSFALQSARRQGVGHILVGSYRVDRGRFVLRLDVQDAASGRTEATASASGRHPGDVLEAVHDVGARLLGALEPRRSAATGNTRPPGGPMGLATRSLEASRLYLEAVDGFTEGGWEGIQAAERRLDEALRIDPAFAQAYLKKAEIEQWRGATGYGNPDPEPAVRSALAHSAGLSDQERLLLASLEALFVRHDTAAALDQWNALLKFHPAFALESAVPSLALQTLQGQSRWDDIVEIGELHVDSPRLPERERAQMHYHLAQAWRRKGDLERAVRHAEQAVRLWPRKSGPRFLGQRAWLARIYLEKGARDAALAELRGVADAPETDAVTLTAAGWGFYMAGAWSEARSSVERALGADPRLGNAHHLRGWLALAGGDYAGAARDLRLAFDLTAPGYGSPHTGMVGGDVAALYYSGVALGKAGRRGAAAAAFRHVAELCSGFAEGAGDAASSAARWQAANYLARARARLGLDAAEPPQLEGDPATYLVQSARLHAVEGRPVQALRELEQGLAAGFGEHQHIRDDPDFESLRDRPEFQRLVGPPSPSS